GVVLRQDARRDIDHGHLCAELGEGGAEFEADIAAADNGKRFRHFRQRQGFGGGNDIAAERQVRQFDRDRAGGDDDVLGADDLRTGLRLDLDRLAVAEAGRALDGFHLRLFQQARDAEIEPSDDLVLPGDRLPEVDFRLRDRDADRRVAGGHFRRHGELVGGVDQRLGRYAADIEAGAARPVRLHDDGVDAELAGADGTDIAAGA